MALTQTSNRNRIRVAGSGFTVFTWQNQPIAFAQQIGHTAPQGVAGPVAIQPMDEPYPVQVVTPAAAGMGTLVLRLYEFYGTQVWERLGASLAQGAGGPTPQNSATGNLGQVTGPFVAADAGGALRGAVDLVDIFIRIAAMQPGVTVVKYIRPPIIQGRALSPYTQEFHGCVITNVADAEEVNVGTMEIVKDVTVAYTYSTRGGAGSAAWGLRNRDFISQTGQLPYYGTGANPVANNP